jgi:hypothetical protein
VDILRPLQPLPEIFVIPTLVAPTLDSAEPARLEAPAATRQTLLLVAVAVGWGPRHLLFYVGGGWPNGWLVTVG